MDLSFTIEEFEKLLNFLSVPHSKEKINNYILHIRLWNNKEMKIARFTRNEYDDKYIFSTLIDT